MCPSIEKPLFFILENIIPQEEHNISFQRYFNNKVKLMDTNRYIGKVLPDNDPKMMGRYKIHIKEIMYGLKPTDGIWCYNEMTYTKGDGMFIYTPIPIGSYVIVTFREDGYYEEGVITSAHKYPSTETTLDRDNEIVINFENMSISINKSNSIINIKNKDTKIEMTPSDITISGKSINITGDETVNINTKILEVAASENITTKTPFVDSTNAVYKMMRGDITIVDSSKVVSPTIDNSKGSITSGKVDGAVINGTTINALTSIICQGIVSGNPVTTLGMNTLFFVPPGTSGVPPTPIPVMDVMTPIIETTISAALPGAVASRVADLKNQISAL
jgi:phage gp45-like